MRIRCSEVPKPTCPSLLWLTEWKSQTLWDEPQKTTLPRKKNLGSVQQESCSPRCKVIYTLKKSQSQNKKNYVPKFCSLSKNVGFWAKIAIFGQILAHLVPCPTLIRLQTSCFWYVGAKSLAPSQLRPFLPHNRHFWPFSSEYWPCRLIWWHVGCGTQAALTIERQPISCDCTKHKMFHYHLNIALVEQVPL